MNSPIDSASLPRAPYRHDPRAGLKPAIGLTLILTLAAAPLFSQVLVDTFAGGKIRTGVPAQDVALAQILQKKAMPLDAGMASKKK